MNRTQGGFRLIERILAVVAMLSMIIALFFGTTWGVVYGDRNYGYFQGLYDKYDVSADLDMQMSDIMDVTQYMMDYLIGREEVLSIETNVEGKNQDFFNEQDRLHMADVRRLFIGGVRLGIILAGVCVIILAALFRKNGRASLVLLRRAFYYALAVIALVLAFVGIMMAVDFTATFTVFHKIFFTNDLWMFDPATDYMIRMLPEGFFFSVARRIGIVFLIVTGVLAILISVFGRGTEKEFPKNKLAK